jgi:hypothetical protein
MVIEKELRRKPIKTKTPIPTGEIITLELSGF